MYQFKGGLKFSPEFAALEPKQDRIIQVKRNSSKSFCALLRPLFRNRICNYKVAFTLLSAGFVAFLSGCGGLTLNSNFLTKGSASASTTVGLSKISCGTQSLTGAQSKECSVYLSAPAAVSTKVSLASSNAALSLPTSITIQAGAISTGFNAVATAVSKSVSVTISGKAGGVSKTAVITLYPASATSAVLSSVSCGTQTLIGPITKACSVYLSAASTSSTVVSLSSNNGALTVPTSVIVPAGSSTGGFGIIALAVGTTQTATLTASAAGVSKTAVFQLSGSGATGSVQHRVQLSWAAPSTATLDKVAGYRVYRSTSSATNYNLLNSTIDVNTSYTDSSVQSGQTYYYVVKSVDTSGVESPPSNATSVIVP